jgi:hypothetical protein
VRIIVYYDRFEEQKIIPVKAFMVEPPSDETFGIAILEDNHERVIIDFYDYVPYSSLMWELA